MQKIFLQTKNTEAAVVGQRKVKLSVLLLVLFKTVSGICGSMEGQSGDIVVSHSVWYEVVVVGV